LHPKRNCTIAQQLNRSAWPIRSTSKLRFRHRRLMRESAAARSARQVRGTRHLGSHKFLFLLTSPQKPHYHEPRGYSHCDEQNGTLRFRHSQSSKQAARSPERDPDECSKLVDLNIDFYNIALARFTTHSNATNKCKWDYANPVPPLCLG
jgi:hypothetical protein